MIGRKLGNRYEVVERLGGGGMAVVYRGMDTLLNRNVSIKVLRSQYTSDEEFIRRFRREAQAAASLSHPNIVNIYDVGQDDEDYFIVMEYVHGCTLKEMIDSRGVLESKEAVQIAKQICEALEHAHAHNIVHRDIKPHNILISKDGRVKVTDFGIARAISANTVTHHGSSVLGSVHYFSPEQARGGYADVKSDVYSLGVVLYEMVTGQVPFTGDSPISIALKHLQENFVEPRDIRPNIPQSVENIILKALVKDPLQRYQSAREMFRDLDRAFIQPNVPKFMSPLRMDEQATIEVPPVFAREDVRETTASEQQDKDSSQPNKSNQPNSKKFWKPVIWLFVILLILVVGVVGGYAAYNTIFFKVPTVTVPNVVGQSYDNAVVTLENAGFKAGQIHKVPQADDKTPADQVISQSPDKGMDVKQDRDINLTVSTGPKQATLPDVTGKTQDDATNTLKAAGFTNIKIVNQPNNQVGKNTVISQDPASGQVASNTTITLTVSSGPDSATVPDVTGKNLADAVNTLQQAGFSPNVVQTPSFKVPANNVIKTNPAANSSAPQGSKIDVYVSNGIPSDAHQMEVEVKVTVNPAKAPVQVLITYTDPTGTDVKAVSEQISMDTTYRVNVYTTPSQNATIKVYQNGKLTDTETVPYQ